MTRNELNALLCTVLTTLAETPDGSAIESTLYTGIGGDIHKWTSVKTILLAGKLATCTGHIVRLTDAGRAMADKVNAFAASKNKTTQGTPT